MVKLHEIMDKLKNKIVLDTRNIYSGKCYYL